MKYNAQLKLNNVNHFARMCRGKIQRQVKAFQHKKKTKQSGKPSLIKSIERYVQSDTVSADNEYLTVSNDSTPKLMLKCVDVRLKLHAVDTGATINVIDRNTCEKIP